MPKNQAKISVTAYMKQKKNNDLDINIHFLVHLGNDKPLRKVISVKNVIKNRDKISIYDLINITGMKLCKRSPSFESFNVKTKTT